MRPPPAIARWLLPILASLLAATGCRLLGFAAVVHDPFQDEPVVVGSRETPARRTIPVEVIFVRCSAEDRQLREAIWEHVDEQVISDERRRALNANGLRVGVVTGQLPAEFADRLATSPVDESVGDIAGIDPTDAAAAAAGLPPIDSLNQWPAISGRFEVVRMTQCHI